MKRSQLGLPGEPVPCVQCARREVGLAWGDYCTICRREREVEANRVGKRVALVAAALVAGWVFWRAPNAFYPRLFGAASVLLAFVIVKRVVARVVLETKPRRADPGGPPDRRTT